MHSFYRRLHNLLSVVLPAVAHLVNSRSLGNAQLFSFNLSVSL